ncbi:MAG: hypothetical protein Ct9H300mP31_14270 [Acidimicrobiaceae bacterium]|nr:MAG: hypothetical protein Ct9H300mP31_14270 [Acidimicrobiaceae bacterium]
MPNEVISTPTSVHQALEMGVSNSALSEAFWRTVSSGWWVAMSRVAEFR